MPKIGGKRNKTKTHLQEDKELPSSVPRSLILRRGRVGIYLQKLIKELRVILYPYCAINLKENKKNSLRDFLSLVDIYNFSHMFAFTNTEKNSYLKIARMPAGPTLTFKLNEYCLSSDISGFNRQDKKETKPLNKIFYHTPLVILNGFGNPLIPINQADPINLVSTMFQSFFPPINFNEIDVQSSKRVLLINLNLDNIESPIFELRNYHINIDNVSGKKTISNILNNKKTDFSGFDNIADYVLQRTGFTDNSDNEGGEGEFNLALKEDKLDKDKEKEKDKKENIGNKEKKRINKVKLTEIGPSMNLSLVKIEEGFFKGNVAYHAIIKKSRKEILEKNNKLKLLRIEKKKRKEEQDANVKKKEEIRRSKMTDEEKEQERQDKYNNERLLKRKRENDEKLKKQSLKETVISKQDMKHLKNLQKGN